ncbi:MAG: YbaK/EbsC family protein [Polaromonas sp.]|nr:YbaK/EbsC family protein [Polaromonas sp.]
MIVGAINMCGSELKVLPEGVQRVAALLQERGHPHMPVMLDDAARTAQQAADALGIALGQIAKSIIFRRKSDDVAVLVITAGDQRVDERKVEALVCPDGKRLGRADAEFVKARTGFSIGGVSPLAHATPPVTLIDQSLFRFAEIWAAAGHPHGVFKLAPQQLLELTGAPVADVVVDPVLEQVSQQSAINLVAAHARRIRAETENIPSPCISVCRMSTLTGWCEGCFRTRDEIAGWSQSGDGGKRAVWDLIEQRIAGLQA